MRVKDVMRGPVTADPTRPIAEIARLMAEKDSSCVVIVDVENRPVGIFTEKDLVRAVARGVPLDTSVGQVMTRNPVTVSLEDHLSTAILRMSERRIRNLPVVDSQGVLRGLVTARDVTEAMKTYYEEVGEIPE